ncbi:MAG: GntR family transcriptional regulator [Oscillibacter sp.]|jgi:DNA-binding GntR family transcriptional regulator|nr:GntR family transcriptional regulator [Oscillibacter sp.]
MDSYTPKYVEIQNFIIDKIRSGILKPYDRIPSENELCRMFKVSRVTANAAISQLALKGVVERVQGKGTFVADVAFPYGQKTESMTRSYKITSAWSADEHQLIAIDRFKASGAQALQLMLVEGEEIYRITELMVQKERKIALDYHLFPASYLPGGFDQTDIEDCYFAEFLREKCGKSPKMMHTHIDVRYPTKSEAQVLEAEESRPLLVWDNLIFDEENKTIGLTSTLAIPAYFRPYINFAL